MLRLSLCVAAASAALVTINNTAPRLDVNGQIVDGHDLSLRPVLDRVSGKFVYVMTTIEYGLCVAPPRMGCDQQPDHCGFRSNHNITVWTSPSLASGSWAKVGDAFPLDSRPPGLIFRPDAIYNPNTRTWVLWYNQASGGNAYVSATSKNWAGPFTNFSTTNTTDSTWEGGDFHLFVDDTVPDGSPAQGYVIWTGMSKQPGLDHKIRISRLTPDFLGVTADEPYMFNFPETQFNEAPSIFSRNGVWYALFGHCCCFCYQGSGLFVFTAATPMGPWTMQSSPVSDISCQAPSVLEAVGATGVPTPGQGCLYGGSSQVAVTRSQQDFVAKLPDGNGDYSYVYYGSRWGQSPDGIKGHEPQYVYPLQWDAQDRLMHITWNDTVTFAVA